MQWGEELLWIDLKMEVDMANILRRKSEPAPLARRDTGWDPFEGLTDVMRFDPFRDFSFPRYDEFVPAFEVKETSKAYVFKADLPGIKEDDVEVSLTGNRLMVSGKREEEKKDENERYFTSERSYGSFSRTFTLPGDVAADQVVADLKDGVLSITIPKSPEAQSKKIPIQAKPRSEKGKAEA